MAVRWYKRIFLKIFLIVWLTSFVVISVTAFMVGSVSERERYREVMQAKALGQAELIVDRYERTGRLPPKPRYKDYDRDHDDDDDWRRDKHDWRDRDHRDKNFFALKMQIQETSSGRIIAGIRDDRHFRNPMVLHLTSSQNKDYRVVVDLDLRKTLFAKLIGFILSVQVVLMMIVAALAALLISWIIVRPLNRLRQHTRQLYNGDLSARADDALNRRGDELGELCREFNRMADYVEQTLQSNQRLLQDVSHELRAPLARLQMAVGLAAQNVPDADQAVIERINLECDRINRLIDEILSLSRLEQMETSDQPFDVARLIDGLIQDYRFSSPDYPLQWQAPATTVQVKGNSALLERALNNILGNAVKHTPAGTTISLQLEATTNGSRIVISDSGPGLSEAQLESLFKPFVRFSDQQNGYGLGLSIALRAVNLLGGELQASSEPGQGLTLTIDLPR
ncbi:MAG: HAMP domain-containing histidine kinase [Amphritea sp.]|nr:HAMP domain-containing histidine kinase [Amphritea sp.]